MNRGAPLPAGHTHTRPHPRSHLLRSHLLFTLPLHTSCSHLLFSSSQVRRAERPRGHRGGGAVVGGHDEGGQRHVTRPAPAPCHLPTACSSPPSRPTSPARPPPCAESGARLLRRRRGHSPYRRPPPTHPHSPAAARSRPVCSPLPLSIPLFLPTSPRPPPALLSPHPSLGPCSCPIKSGHCSCHEPTHGLMVTGN